jgi:hypothetical protein
MGKITPTFADNLIAANGQLPGPMHVVEAHEPLSEGGWKGYGHIAPQQMGSPGIFDQPATPVVVSTPIPAVEPVKKKRGRKAKTAEVPALDPSTIQAPYAITTVGQMTSPVPVAEPAPLKIALIGTAPSSRMLAPFGDPTWQIWGCSPGNMNALPRADAWFEIHANLLWPEYESYGKPYIEWLKQLKIPVYMQDQSQVPNATTFPWQELTQEFGEDFFTSSFAWMMAFAMKVGAKEIGLFGIDMASRDEYILQRPGFYFFRHEARKRGIKVTAPNESDIMQSPPLYAISDSFPFGRKILARETEIKGRIAAMGRERDQKTAEAQQISNNITYLQGALEDLDYVKAIWSGLGAQALMTDKRPL